MEIEERKVNDNHINEEINIRNGPTQGGCPNREPKIIENTPRGGQQAKKKTVRGVDFPQNYFSRAPTCNK